MPGSQVKLVAGLEASWTHIQVFWVQVQGTESDYTAVLGVTPGWIQKFGIN